MGVKTSIYYDLRGLWVDFLSEARGKKKTIVHSLMQYIDIQLINACDGVILISDELDQILLSRNANPKKKLITYGDGADVAGLHKIEKKNLKKYLGITGTIVGYLGSISTSRSSDKIIEAFSIVKKIKPEIHLVFIGPIYHEKQIRTIVADHGLQDSIHFTGFMETHNEAISYTKDFDVALAYHEIDKNSFNVMVPTKVLEYLACELPIVASNHKAHRNILTDNENAVLTEPTSEDYARGIKKILQDKQLSDKLRKNARKESYSYSFKTIAKKIIDFYNK
jgi:glycosyltransferase involved in cell wall biosynthesis